MNTDKLMELEQAVAQVRFAVDGLEFRGEGESKAALYVALDPLVTEVETLLGALRAEQAVGDEQIARELLNAEYKRTHGANPRVNLGEAEYGVALRAIRRALGTARQSEGVVLRDSVLSSARFRAACYALVGIIEGVEGAGRSWAANGERLKDTREWAAFYNIVARMRNGLAAAPGGEGEV